LFECSDAVVIDTDAVTLGAIGEGRVALENVEGNFVLVKSLGEGQATDPASYDQYRWGRHV
jgi:hypothetical protein